MNYVLFKYYLLCYDVSYNAPSPAKVLQALGHLPLLTIVCTFYRLTILTTASLTISIDDLEDLEGARGATLLDLDSAIVAFNP